MKVVKRVGSRRFLMLVPFALLIIFVVAMSGPIASGGAYGLSEPLPPPVPGFTPAPLPGPGSFNSIVTVAMVDALLADNANHGNAVAPNVHIIDVRSSFEYLADVCPMQIALGLPTYSVTNVGHPSWNWPDATHEEAMSDPYWIGFHWAGVPYASLWNIRMQENPNFGSYLSALEAEGMIKKNDNLIFLCQTGYRASWAGQEAAGMGFTNVNVLHGGMLAWSDDWYADDGMYHDNLPSDPSPGDCPAGLPGGEVNCDPDNTPGPAARPKSTVLSAPWQYDIARLGGMYPGGSAYWNGTEPHVGVKPEWMPGDFQLAPSTAGALWASYADYEARLLTVNLKLTNNPPAPPSPLNYPSSCGGAPAPAGSCEQVYQAAHGTAYNSTIVNALATNGVTVATTGLGSVPALIGNIAANTAGTTAVKFHIPVDVGSFHTNVFATATDVPDPAAPMGPAYAWYFTYTYPGPPPTA
ncbi:MAG: rhodanese-like domain-containing protein [Thermoleophilia bacterium]